MAREWARGNAQLSVYRRVRVACSASAHNVDEFMMARAVSVPVAILASPLAIPLALSAADGLRRMLRRCCGRCCGISGCDFVTGLIATVGAYVVTCSISAAASALLLPACFDPNATLLARFGVAIAALVALHSLLFATSHPRGVLAMAMLALATLGAVVFLRVERHHAWAPA